MADGTIYVGTGTSAFGSEDSGNFYALNPDGSQKWKFPTVGTIVGTIESSPAIGADGTIYFTSRDCTVYALNPDGTQKWNFTLTTGACEGVNTPVIGTDGTVYVGYTTQFPPDPLYLLSVYYALNPNGTQKWKFDFAGHGSGGGSTSQSAAIGGDGTIYAVSIDGNFAAINPDGTQRWSAGGDGSPAIGPDGTIYEGFTIFPHGGGGFVAFNPSGSVKWTSNVGGGFGDSAIGADGTIYVGSVIPGTPFQPPISNQYAFDPDGTAKWNVAGADGASAIGADGTLVAAGSLYAIH